MHSTPIKTLIVDDEPPARDLITRLLHAEPGIEIVGTSVDGRDAIAAIEHHTPDLVFLDVQMPGMDGFGVLEAARPARAPDVVFVTAYDAHAVRAFELHAVDYLLKPFEYGRLREAVQRFRGRRAAGARHAWRALVDDVRRASEAWDRIAVRDGKRTVFVDPADVEYVEAEENYVRLYAGAKSHLLHETMHGMEQRLADRNFVRVSRSALINLGRLREMESLAHGDAVVTLQGGRRITVTRSYRFRLAALLQQLR